MRIDVISIFPEYLSGLELSLIGKAAKAGLLDIRVHDLRDWTHDRHRTVDDTPYSGGAGMVMKPEPWGEALDDLAESYESDERPTLIFTSPSGEVFNQKLAEELSAKESIAFACGRYEGIDARVAKWANEKFDVREVSIGDYVLNGGEVAAMVMTEAIVRLIPGVIGNPQSLVEESYSDAEEGLLEYPIYTKPASWRGLDVPEILLSGNHGKIDRWRREQSRMITSLRRPELLEEGE